LLIPKKKAILNLAGNKARVLQRERDSVASNLSDWMESSRSMDALEEVIDLGRYGRVLTVVSVLKKFVH